MTSAFAVSRAALRERADVNFAIGSMAVAARYMSPAYPLVPVADLASVVQYGCSVRATVEAQGVPIVRMSNLRDDGLDLTDIKYVMLTDAEVERYQLFQGDLLFNRTNSKELVGKCAVYRSEGVHVFASYLIRVQLDLERVVPEYISFFLNTDAGRVQIDRVSRRILGMSNVNSDEVRSLLIPLPPIDVQLSLVSDLTAALVERAALLANAQRALLDFSLEVQDLSGIPVRPARDTQTHAVERRVLAQSKRLDANYHHPRRRAALLSLDAHAPGTAVLALGQVIELVREPATVGEGEPYLGLASVESHTGRLLSEGVDETAQAALRFSRGDVLYCRLRPYLNKVWKADREGLCSTEFRVLRLRPEAPIEDAEFLAAVLRTPAVCEQASYAAAGNTHPRLSDEDLLGLLVFAPHVSAQRSLLKRESHRRAEALAKQASAEELWATAKTRFESAVLPFPSTGT